MIAMRIKTKMMAAFSGYGVDFESKSEVFIWQSAKIFVKMFWVIAENSRNYRQRKKLLTTKETEENLSKFFIMKETAENERKCR